ncbi:hypothetical protein BGS_0699 [Beggiatoa sp. SS]|nr:hypothetical protein BGS_0699 [Beggiatoa sp. SS]
MASCAVNGYGSKAGFLRNALRGSWESDNTALLALDIIINNRQDGFPFPNHGTPKGGAQV